MLEGMRETAALLVGLVGFLLCCVAPVVAQDDTSAGTSAVGAASELSAPVRERIDAYLTDERTAHGIPGLSLAVVAGGRMVYSTGYGSAGRGPGAGGGTAGGAPAAMSASTALRIGSATKTFTALALVELAGEGRVDLDAPVSGYMPAFDLLDERAERVITVRHLLSHTGGIPAAAGLWASKGTLNPDAEAPGPREETPVSRLARRIAAVVAERGLAAGAGEEFIYSNANYVAAGAVIEAATGQEYGAYLTEEVLAPNGVIGCYLSPAAADRAGRPVAQGHARGLAQMTLPLDAEVGPGELPGAGLVCTAQAMGRYLEVLLAGNRQSQLWEPQIPARGAGVPAGASYGLGWFLNGSGEDFTVWHAGTVSTSQSTLRLYPGQNTGVFVGMNVNGVMLFGLTDALTEGVHTILRGGEPQPFTPLETARTTRLMVAAGASVSLLWVLVSINAVRLRRRRGQFPVRTRGALVRSVGLPLIIDAVILFFFLVAVPAGFNVGFSDLLRVSLDIFMLSVIGLAPVAVWAATRTVLAFLAAPGPGTSG